MTDPPIRNIRRHRIPATVPSDILDSLELRDQAMSSTSVRSIPKVAGG